MDGAEVATLAGDAESYTAEGLAVGDHEICITAMDGGTTCSPICCTVTVEMQFIRGDANADGTINIADPVKALSYIFSGDTVPCLVACDANDDGGVDVADPIRMLDYIFGSSTIPAPTLECGVDPTADDLGCDSYPPCAP